MEKFLLTLTKGNDRSVLSICDTKDEALAKGNALCKTLTKDSGFLALISGEVDKDNNFTGGKYKLWHGWT